MIDYSQITQDDMSNLIRFFKIPTYLYDKWSLYACDHDLSMKKALTQILSCCQAGCWYEYYGEHDYNNIITTNVKEFMLDIPKSLQPEIYKIFIQTHYKTGSIEFNKEILTRLAIILKEDRVYSLVLIFIQLSHSQTAYRGSRLPCS